MLLCYTGSRGATQGESVGGGQVDEGQDGPARDTLQRQVPEEIRGTTETGTRGPSETLPGGLPWQRHVTTGKNDGAGIKPLYVTITVF